MFTFGSDPEFTLVKDGRYRSAIGIIQGATDNRIKIRGHEFYYDNALAEAAIKPSSTKEDAVANFRECLQLYAEMAQPFRLVAQAAQNYERSELDHPEAKKVNCDPEHCPYLMKQASSPIEEILYGTLRTCGGHVHLGHEGLIDTPEAILAMYMCDIFLGIPSLWLDKDPTSLTRRSMYGAAGRYRVKSYGMEYRSLSNFWLQTPRLVAFVFEMSQFITEYVVSGQAWKHWTFDLDVFYNTDNLADAWTCHTYDVMALRDAIRTGDKGLAAESYKLAQELMPSRLRAEMLELCDVNPGELYSEWGLKVA